METAPTATMIDAPATSPEGDKPKYPPVTPEQKERYESAYEKPFKLSEPKRDQRIPQTRRMVVDQLRLKFSDPSGFEQWPKPIQRALGQDGRGSKHPDLAGIHFRIVNLFKKVWGINWDTEYEPMAMIDAYTENKISINDQQTTVKESHASFAMNCENFLQLFDGAI